MRVESPVEGFSSASVYDVHYIEFPINIINHALSKSNILDTEYFDFLDLEFVGTREVGPSLFRSLLHPWGQLVGVSKVGVVACTLIYLVV